MIGIIGAMKSEIDDICKYVSNSSKMKILNVEFILGTMYNKEIVLCVSDEGKVNSTIATTLMINNFNITTVINMGVAGSTKNDVNIFDLVISSSTTQHDYDLSSLNYEKGYVLGVNEVKLKCDMDIANKVSEICASENVKSHIGNIATGDIFVTDEDIKKEVVTRYDSLCIDMESAAINHVCYLNNIKCICIRAISDSGSKIEFREFLEKSVKILTTVILRFLKEYDVNGK